MDVWDPGELAVGKTQAQELGHHTRRQRADIRIAHRIVPKIYPLDGAGRHVVQDVKHRTWKRSWCQ